MNTATDAELGLDDVMIECRIAGWSTVARRRCATDALWVVRFGCSKNSGHTRGTPWWPTCTPCLDLTQSIGAACPKCGARVVLQKDVL